MSQQGKLYHFLSKGWVSSIGVFLLTQLFFYLCTAIGWYPNFRPIKLEVLLNFLETDFYNKWLHFYEVDYFNLSTIAFTVFFLIPGLIGCFRELSSLITARSRSHT